MVATLMQEGYSQLLLSLCTSTHPSSSKSCRLGSTSSADLLYSQVVYRSWSLRRLDSHSLVYGFEVSSGSLLHRRLLSP